LKLLVIGADSQIGSALVALLTERAVPFEPLGFIDTLDITATDLEKRIRENSVAKGSVLEVARLAGILAAKRTDDHITASQRGSLCWKQRNIQRRRSWNIPV